MIRKVSVSFKSEKLMYLGAKRTVDSGVTTGWRFLKSYY